MSIATEISRLQTAKSDLKTSIENKGVTVPSATTLDGYAALVDQISGGGGSSDPFTLNYTITSDANTNTITDSVPKSQVDSIVSNKPTVLRVVKYNTDTDTTNVYGYVLLSAEQYNGVCIYLPPNTTNTNVSITVTSSSFKQGSTTYSYNSNTDCYEHSLHTGGDN